MDIANIIIIIAVVIVALAILGGIIYCTHHKNKETHYTYTTRNADQIYIATPQPSNYTGPTQITQTYTIPQYTPQFVPQYTPQYTSPTTPIAPTEDAYQAYLRGREYEDMIAKEEAQRKEEKERKRQEKRDQEEKKRDREEQQRRKKLVEASTKSYGGEYYYCSSTDRYEPS